MSVGHRRGRVARADGRLPAGAARRTGHRLRVDVAARRARRAHGDRWGRGRSLLPRLTLTDQRVIDLAGELGLGDSIRWRRLGVGFFHDGRLASMSTPRELLTFPGLRARDRVRLVAFVARCRTISDRSALDDEPIEHWPGTWPETHLGAALAPAARLEVRRPLRRPSRHLPVVAHAAHRRDARPLGPRGHGLDRRRPPGARGRARARDRAARRRAAARHDRDAHSVCERACPGRRRGRPAARSRPRDLDAAAPAARRAALARAGGGAAARPVPLPRRRLRRRARARERQPLLHAQHHRPPRAAHERGRDHPRGRSRARGRAPPVRAEVRDARLAGARAQLRRDDARLPGSGADDVPGLRPGARRAREPGGPGAACRAHTPRRRSRNGFRRSSLRRASSSPRRRTCTQTSSTARRSSGWPSAWWKNCIHGWTPCSGRRWRHDRAAPSNRRLSKESSLTTPTRIGVTGGAGFIGSHLCERLLGGGP